MRKRKKERKSKLAVWWLSWKAQGFAGLGLYVGLIVACAAVIGTVAGLRAMERRVLGGQVTPLPQMVKLTFENLPEWMPNDLGTQIAVDLMTDAGSYNDPRLVATVCERAQAHPWIARVERVTKRLASTQRPDANGQSARDGEVVIRAHYRQPVARVQNDTGKFVGFVDEAGVRLPDVVPTHQAAVLRNGIVETRWFLPTSAHVMPPDAKPLHYVVIHGVTSPPPPVGKAWSPDADDLRDGLKLASKLRRYAWREQITTIDVRNYAGRLDPAGSWLRMHAKAPQGHTSIQFGRFPQENGDWEISPDEKLDSLDTIVRDRNGLARREIDLRYANPWASKAE